MTSPRTSPPTDNVDRKVAEREVQFELEERVEKNIARAREGEKRKRERLKS